jgi:hypothetical protein
MLILANMTTTLLIVGAIWVALAFVFCLALCAAAARPLPEFDGGERLFEPESQATEEIGEGVLCGS